MPTVPTVQGPQVKLDALRPVQQSQIDVSSGAVALGRGLVDASESLDRIALRDSQAKAYEAESNITMGWLKWDAENRPKYRGGNIDGYEAAAATWWKDASASAKKDLDRRTQTLVGNSLMQKQTAAMGNVLTFSGAERERHADETYSADIGTTVQFAVTTGDVAGGANQIRQKAAMVGARKGWTTEQVQAEQQKNLSALHMAQITKLSSSNAVAAQAYYDANKAEVGFGQQARVEEILKGELDNQFATATAAAMAGKPLAEQIKEAGAITDPQRREKVLNQVRNNYALVKQAEAEREEQFSDQAWQLHASGRRIPESVLMGMDGKERAQLAEAQRARAERSAAGGKVKTDPHVYIELRERMAAGEKINLRAYTEKIGNSEMEKLLDIQTAAKSGGSKQDSMISDSARIDNAILSMGIDKKKNPDEAMRIENEIDRRVRQESEAKGNRPLSPGEKQAVVDRVALDKVSVPGMFGSKEKPAFLLDEDEVGKAYVVVDKKRIPLSSISAGERVEITKALREMKWPVSEKAIVEWHLKSQAAKSKPATAKPASNGFKSE
jgi:hypothetical protein